MRHPFVPTIENGEEFCIRVCFSFFFLFSTRNQVPINYRTGLSDISFNKVYASSEVPETG